MRKGLRQALTVWAGLVLAMAMSVGLGAQTAPAYHEIERFVINLAGERQARFLQLNLQLEVADARRLPDVQTHLPQLRDALVQTLGGRDPDTVSSADGREALRAEVLDVLQKMMTDITGEPVIEAVYFRNVLTQ